MQMISGEDSQLELNTKSQNVNITTNEILVILGHDVSFKTDETRDLILLLAKFFSYKSRFDNWRSTYERFLVYLKARYKVEKYISHVQMCHEQFSTRWSTYLPMLD